MDSIYDFKLRDIDGLEYDFNSLKGKVVLIVNTASKCGFTPQFKGLEDLYREFKDKGLEIIGFPCNQFAGQDPGTSDEISSFCRLNYGVTFKMMEKIDVNGSGASPLYKFLKSKKKGFLTDAIKWNFTKFLIDREGNVVERFSPKTEADEIRKKIEKLL